MNTGIAARSAACAGVTGNAGLPHLVLPPVLPPGFSAVAAALSRAAACIGSVPGLAPVVPVATIEQVDESSGDRADHYRPAIVLDCSLARVRSGLE